VFYSNIKLLPNKEKLYIKDEINSEALFFILADGIALV